jgi:hypothetical protein
VKTQNTGRVAEIARRQRIIDDERRRVHAIVAKAAKLPIDSEELNKLHELPAPSEDYYEGEGEP